MIWKTVIHGCLLFQIFSIYGGTPNNLISSRKPGKIERVLGMGLGKPEWSLGPQRKGALPSYYRIEVFKYLMTSLTVLEY